MNENEREFLVGLARLTRETGVKIDGCGCCGSPFLVHAEDRDMLDDVRSGYAYTDRVIWVSPGDAYDWENESEHIVRG